MFLELRRAGRPWIGHAAAVRSGRRGRASWIRPQARRSLPHTLGVCLGQQGSRLLRFGNAAVRPANGGVGPLRREAGLADRRLQGRASPRRPGARGLLLRAWTPGSRAACSIGRAVSPVWLGRSEYPSSSGGAKYSSLRPVARLLPGTADDRRGGAAGGAATAICRRACQAGYAPRRVGRHTSSGASCGGAEIPYLGGPNPDTTAHLHLYREHHRWAGRTQGLAPAPRPVYLWRISYTTTTKLRGTQAAGRTYIDHRRSPRLATAKCAACRIVVVWMMWVGGQSRQIAMICSAC